MQKSDLSRRQFIGTGTAAGVAALTGCGGTPDKATQDPPSAPEPFNGAAAKGPQPKGRVVILGFDGVEPSVVERMLDAGELPSLAKLRSGGAYTRMRTTIPPQSPAAWTSFATCKNPGKHGIYDFIRRNPKTYFPEIGTGTTSHPEFGPDGSVRKPATSEAFRKGESFWSVADRHQLRSKILNVPFVYPPDKLRNGIMISGLGVRDIRGTDSTFFSLSDAYEKEENVGGGIRLPLQFDGDTAEVSIPGARDPRKKYSDPDSHVHMPVMVTADRDARSVTLGAQGQTFSLAEGEWSDWFRCTFEVTPDFSVHAISRFYVTEVAEQVRVYMACLQYDPEDPYVPFSNPRGYSAELADRYGLYKTVGWAYDTKALQKDALDEDAFLEDVDRTMTWRERLTLDEIERGDFDLLISAWTATDRVGHMFWRYRDPKHPLYDEECAKKYGDALERTYRKMDEIAGKVMAKLDENDLLIVLSDHGFDTFRTGFNVNRWLVENGYAALAPPRNPNEQAGEQGFLRDFDWASTKVYAFGVSSMYVNMKGRERGGIVEPGEADALIAEVREKLLALTGPDTGEKVFDDIYTRADYEGADPQTAPDFVFGYQRGFQNSKGTVSGKAPQEIFEPCLDKWSGEHSSNSMAQMPGILFANSALPLEGADIRDLGVTALAYLGLSAPDDFEGRSLLA